jgi:hypothetical protein
VNWKKKKSGGIKIICQSEMRDFSAMAFITDHVNSLIDQWFPGKRIFWNQAFDHAYINIYMYVYIYICVCVCVCVCVNICVYVNRCISYISMHMTYIYTYT